MATYYDHKKYHVTIEQIMRVLEQCEFSYPSSRMTSQWQGFSETRIIAVLFEHLVDTGHLASCDELLELVLQHVDGDCSPDNLQIQNRAKKFVLDFLRESHCAVLLDAHPDVQNVFGSPMLDTANVDFLVALSYGGVVGVQAQMRLRWANDEFSKFKAARRAERGGFVWRGKLYYLTNRERPAASNGCRCWLFTPEHVDDLMCEVRVDRQPIPCF